MPTGEWPTRADVELRLIDLGFVTIHVADDGMQTQVCAIGRSALTDSSVAEAISLMENEAGWKLLADPEPKAVLHDPPGQKASFYSYPRGGERLLRLSQPAWEITSVKTNAVYGDANSGHPMTLYQDVFPRGPDQDCATVLEFRQPVAGNALSVEVVAVEEREEYVLEKLVLYLNGIEPVPAFFVRPLEATGPMPAPSPS